MKLILFFLRQGTSGWANLDQIPVLSFSSLVASLNLTPRIYNMGQHVTREACSEDGTVPGPRQARGNTSFFPSLLFMSSLLHPWASQWPCEVDSVGMIIPISQIGKPKFRTMNKWHATRSDSYVTEDLGIPPESAEWKGGVLSKVAW